MNEGERDAGRLTERECGLEWDGGEVGTEFEWGRVAWRYSFEVEVGGELIWASASRPDSVGTTVWVEDDCDTGGAGESERDDLRASEVV